MGREVSSCAEETECACVGTLVYVVTCVCWLCLRVSAGITEHPPATQGCPWVAAASSSLSTHTRAGLTRGPALYSGNHSLRFPSPFSSVATEAIF